MAEATVCPGCGEEVDVFSNHLSANVKVERSVSQTFTASQLALSAGETLTYEMLDADEDENTETVVGTKSGPSAGGVFHDTKCLVKFLRSDEFPHSELKLKKDRSDDSHLYAAAAAEGGDN